MVGEAGSGGSWFQRFLLPGFALKAVIIGGGYATGRELAEYFVPAGPWGGLAGMLLATLIWSVVAALTFALARQLHAYDYRSFFQQLLGPGWVLFEVERVLVDEAGTEVALSSGEYHLLHALVRHPRQVMSRDRLLDLVRGREADIFDRAIDNLVSRLRKKIEEDPAHPQIVKTVWGGGYTLACEVKRLGPAA